MRNTGDSLTAVTGPPTVPLEHEEANELALTGGKGANLARLREASLPVPRGFCVTTGAYRSLVDAPELRRAIESLDALDPDDAETIAETSATIRSKIREHELPANVRETVTDSLDRLGADAYAVRSSATAEDLPTASFAGQHESFLGVKPDAVIERIRDCMASLFTERAVAYRLENDVPNDEVAMAVVVQAMVDPEVAGVLFTADPVSGNRTVATVDANYGVGDTVVAGEVSPDNARVDRETGEVLAYEVGEKGHALRVGDDGTETVEMSSEERAARALSDAQLRDLVDLGGEVEDLLGSPQDIEWALTDEGFVLLQSRPITSLFPLPSPIPDDDHLHVYFSFGHQQAMAEALPPLVVDWLRAMHNNTVARTQESGTDPPVAVEAANRVYIDLNPLLRRGPTRRGITRGLESVSEPAAWALEDLLDRRPESVPHDGRLEQLRAAGRVGRRILPAVAPTLPTLASRFLGSFVRGPIDPEQVREQVETKGETLAERITEPSSQAEQLRTIFEGESLGTTVVAVGSLSMPRFLAGVVAGGALERLFPDAEEELAALGSGFEDEIATQINQRLADLADVARQHPEVADALADGASLSEVSQTDGGDQFVSALDTFLEDFGHRTSNEMDLSRPRWRDDPETLLRTIRSTLEGDDAGDSRAHLSDLKANAQAAATSLQSRAGRGVIGSVRQPLVRRLIDVYRGGIQLREHHKHGLARYLAAVHDRLARAGESLAGDGRLDRPADVWYLRKGELIRAFESDGALGVDIDERRRTHERYASMTAPPLLTSEGETLSSAAADAPDGALTGTPVSAGVVEGDARVIHDPAEESLEEGEILVAPSTDVGWTPLFQNAQGLVMEVGGQMTHGALVAREYGIPAVVSVSDVTTAIRTGERIRIDGGRGTVELLDRTDDTASESGSSTSDDDGT